MMHSMSLVMFALLALILLVGGLLGALRVYAGRQVESDHPSHPAP